MATSQPKPAQGGADAHRDSPEHDEDDDEEQAPMPPAGPEDRDGGGGGSDDAPASPGSGTTRVFGVSAKKIALAAGILLGAYLLWTLWKNRQQISREAATSTERRPERDEGNPAPEEEVVNIEQDPDDPLKADHQAGKRIFGWGED